MEPDEQYAALDRHRLAGDERDAAAREPAAQQVPRLGARLRAAGPGACVIHGNQNYKQTGLLQAYAAYSLLQQPPKRVGFASGCQAFGHRELLGVLRSFGLVPEPVLRRGLSRVRLVDYLDKGASLGPGRALPDHRP